MAIILILVFNLTVDGMRIVSPDWYRIKEVKLKKAEKVHKLVFSHVHVK